MELFLSSVPLLPAWWVEQTALEEQGFLVHSAAGSHTSPCGQTQIAIVFLLHLPELCPLSVRRLFLPALPISWLPSALLPPEDDGCSGSRPLRFPIFPPFTYKLLRSPSLLECRSPGCCCFAALVLS